MNLESMSNEELIAYVKQLRKQIFVLETENSELSWKINPDRMGGQFTASELNRRGDEWS